MPRYLLDTDHVSLYQRGNLTVRAAVVSRDPSEIGVTIITIEEQLKGRLAETHRAQTPRGRLLAYAAFHETVEFHRHLIVEPFGEAAEQHYQRLRALRLRIGSQDQKIAAVAIAAESILVTRNRRDFDQIPGLVTEDWS